VIERKGYSIAFTKQKALMCPSNGYLSSSMTIGTRESGLYKITCQFFQALVGILVVVIDINPSHWFSTPILIKVFGHEG
jgi:hypothetical protein